MCESSLRFLAQVVPSSQLNIPKKYHWQVTLMGYAIGARQGGHASRVGLLTERKSHASSSSLVRVVRCLRQGIVHPPLH